MGVLYLLALAGPGRLRDRPELLRCRYAHRGLHNLADGVPENSLEAFRRAAERGFGAELDIHLTRDGRLAVIHDSSLRRACGADAEVEDLTAAQLRAYRLFGTGAAIPFLEDVLPLFEHRGPLLVELKTRRNARPLAAALCRALAGYRGQVLAESFDPRVLLALRRLQPDLLRGQLSKNFRRDGSCNALAALLLGGLCLNFLSRPDFIAYRFADRQNLSLRLCRRLFHLGEMDWTITDPAALREAEAGGAAAIFEGFQPDP